MTQTPLRDILYPMLKPIQPTPSDPAVNCPKCHTTMLRLDTGTVAIDRCERCGAVWLDAGELAVLLKFSGDKKELVESIDQGGAVKMPETHAPGTIHCPRDSSPMSTVRDKKQKHIEFEMCMNCCGVLFDAGELSDISSFTLRERVRAMFEAKAKK